tara:strand:- start:916 stop:1179 length:264 start_codon:yes stop_codon:yes gene_type:complete
METTALSLLKKVGYKDIFNYLYTIKYKDQMSFEQIIQADYDQRKFFENLFITVPESVCEPLSLPTEGDPVVIAAQIFHDLYSNQTTN